MIKVIASVFFVIVIPQLVSTIIRYLIAFKVTIISLLVSPFLEYGTVVAILSLACWEIFLGIYHYFKH